MAHPLSDPERIRVSERRDRQVCLDLDERDVGVGVDARTRAGRLRPFENFATIRSAFWMTW